jgi:glycosyltransferase involved in cell wall biosynthesis
VAHFVAAPNQAMVDLLACRTGRPAFLITHGVDTELFKPERRYRTDRTFRIGYVGRLTPEKNVRTLANLERKMEMAGATDYRFVLVGNGSERDWLRSHLARAHFTGVLRGTELAAAFANFDAFVFPSQTDTFGLVVLEAMAAGVPVVALPEAGRRAGVVDHVNGLLSNDFAPSILELMWHPAERLRLGEAARHWACECTWTRAFEDLYRVYDEGLNSGDVRRRRPPPRFTPVNGGPNYA